MRMVGVSALVVSLMVAGSVLAQQRGGMGMGGPGMGGGGMGPGMGGPGAQQGMMGQYGYRGIDRNGDGVIAREELREHQRLLEQLQANWEQADRNGDGRVDVSEFSAFEQSMR